MKTKLIVMIGIFLIALVYFSGTPVEAGGNPVLLTEIQRNFTSSYCCNAVPPASMTFCVGYDYLGGGVGSSPSTYLTTKLGCTQAYTSGTQGSFDFNTTNSNDFSIFANRITDGVDDKFTDCILTLDSNGLVTVPSSCGTGFESGILNGNPDFTGYSLEFVRLIINKINASQTDPDPNFGNTANIAEYDIVWQFWGVPISNEIPEFPAVGLPVMIALGLMFIFGLRKQKQ